MTEVVKFLGAQMAKNANEKFIVNGIYMKSDEVEQDLVRKRHGFLCPIQKFMFLFPYMSRKGCVNNAKGLDQGREYKSVRSEEMAHRIHIEKLKQGIVDLEPIRPALTIAAFGFAVGVAALGVSKLISACKGID